jgi:Protein of unknown function (DUF3071)
MQELRFVAVSEDGSYAVLAVPGRSGRFMLPIDDRLRAVARGQFSRLAQFEIEVENPLRPKEIQARIRAGETVEEIADAAGIPVERVRWFEGPVLAERAYVAEQAQGASIRRQGDSTPGPRLGEVVAERLTELGADPEDAQWDSRKHGDGSWQVQLAFRSGGRLHIAEWLFDPRRRHVAPADDNAIRLSMPEAELPPPAGGSLLAATVTPIRPRPERHAPQHHPEPEPSPEPAQEPMRAASRGLASPPVSPAPAPSRGPAARPPAASVSAPERPAPRPAPPQDERPARAPQPPAVQEPEVVEPVAEEPVAEEPVAREPEPRERPGRAPAAPAAQASRPPAAAGQAPAAQARTDEARTDEARTAQRPARQDPARGRPAQAPGPKAASAQARDAEPQAASSNGRSQPAPQQAPDQRAEEAPAPARGRGKKAAQRGRRSSVPSWDEIMLGNNRND